MDTERDAGLLTCNLTDCHDLENSNSCLTRSTDRCLRNSFFFSMESLFYIHHRTTHTYTQSTFTDHSINTSERVLWIFCGPSGQAGTAPMLAKPSRLRGARSYSPRPGRAGGYFPGAPDGPLPPPTSPRVATALADRTPRRRPMPPTGPAKGTGPRLAGMG